MALPTVEEILEKDIFELLGVANTSAEEKQALLAKLTSVVDARVINRVAELLSEKEAEEFATLAEAGDGQKLADFLVDKEIDLAQIVSEEATKYRVEFVQLVKLAES